MWPFEQSQFLHKHYGLWPTGPREPSCTRIPPSFVRKVDHRHVFHFLHIFISLKSVSAASDRMPVTTFFSGCTMRKGQNRSKLKVEKHRWKVTQGDNCPASEQLEDPRPKNNHWNSCIGCKGIKAQGFLCLWSLLVATQVELFLLLYHSIT